MLLFYKINLKIWMKKKKQDSPAKVLNRANTFCRVMIDDLPTWCVYLQSSWIWNEKSIPVLLHRIETEIIVIEEKLSNSETRKLGTNITFKLMVFQWDAMPVQRIPIFIHNKWLNEGRMNNGSYANNTHCCNPNNNYLYIFFFSISHAPKLNCFSSAQLVIFSVSYDCALSSIRPHKIFFCSS